jgi:tetratricopeptide (TPR) repeat protein
VGFTPRNPPRAAGASSDDAGARLALECAPPMSTLHHDEAMARARGAMRAAQPQNAVQILIGAASQTHLQARDYDEVVRLLADALQQIGLLRAAGSVWLYLKDGPRLAHVSAAEPRDLARAAILDGNYALAAQQYRLARWPAHAAIASEKARLFPQARLLWEEVQADPRLREDPYNAALVSFNLGRVLTELRDAPGAQRGRVRAMRLLEEAADLFEARGLRERAFDCFQVLLTLGAETGSFENLAEGYLNCVRILREDHLKYYALQYYEDFIKRAMEAKEHHAVATIVHEAADYARSLGLPFHAALRTREAEAWRNAAEQILRSGGSVELAENALLAAVGAFAGIGMHASVVGVFGMLARMPGIEDDRAKRYARLRERYADAKDEAGRSAPVPEYLKAPVAYPDIWNVDVIEWEEDGDAVEACGEILLDGTLPDFVRRKALLARLVPLTAREPGHPNTLAQLAESLGQVQLYAMLSPLEHLFDRGRGDVRVAVLRAARSLFFKRTFMLLMKGVAEPDPAVRAAAVEAIQLLHFPHAFDPLSRLHRDQSDVTVRAAALNSIGRIPSLEAVEYLIGTLRHGSAEERQLASDLLVRHDATEATGAIQAALAQESGDLQQLLINVLRRRSR